MQCLSCDHMIMIHNSARTLTVIMVMTMTIPWHRPLGPLHNVTRTMTMTLQHITTIVHDHDPVCHLTITIMMNTHYPNHEKCTVHDRSTAAKTLTLYLTISIMTS